jgi:hypothetical protein
MYATVSDFWLFWRGVATMKRMSVGVEKDGMYHFEQHLRKVGLGVGVDRCMLSREFFMESGWCFALFLRH